MAEPETSVLVPITRNGTTVGLRDYQIILALCLGACLLIQGGLCWFLIGTKPPDQSWPLIEKIMDTCSQLELLFGGGLLGMARGKG